jgi:hypothetical protein
VQLFKYTFLLFAFAVATACAQSSDNPAASFSQPQLTPAEQTEVLSKYDYLDPQNLVPNKALSDAVLYFDANFSKIKNKNYMAVIDFSKNSRESRFYIINMKNGVVWKIHVAHGKGSDPDFDGNATSFSNEFNSNKSSLGFYLTGETYYGEHGLSLRLDGLSATNSNARDRAIVIHGASYVQEANQVQGRSWGCPAVDMRLRDQVVNFLKNGSLLYTTR